MRAKTLRAGMTNAITRLRNLLCFLSAKSSATKARMAIRTKIGSESTVFGEFGLVESPVSGLDEMSEFGSSGPFGSSVSSSGSVG